MPSNLIPDTNGMVLPDKRAISPPRSVTNIITNGFFTVDGNWIVKSWNSAAEELAGVPAKDVIGKNLWDTFAAVLPVLFYSTHRNALLRNIPPHFNVYWPHLKCLLDVFTFYNKGSLSVSFKSGQPLLSVNPQDQSSALNELYRFVLEITNDCLWEWNISSKEIFWIDGGHKRVFGYPIENTLIPESFWESRLHPDDKLRILTGLKKIINESLNPVWEDEYRFRKQNNEYAYVHDRGHIIRGEGDVAIRMVGATQDITARKLAEIQLLEERQTTQLQVTSAVITAQENERLSISRELHDNFNQVLAVTKLYIEMASSESTDKDIYLGKSLDLITNVMIEVRKMSRTMATPGMNGLGLFDTVRNLINDLSALHPVKIAFNPHRVEENSLDEKLQLTIYRIIQEQCINILRHSDASAASIDLTRGKPGMILEIRDNGKGCDTSQTADGVGLRNIMSRAELYRGVAETISKPGEGFLLKVIFQYS